MPRNSKTSIAVASLAASLDLQDGQAPTEFRLIPAGPFQSWDGRPGNGLSWQLSDQQAAVIVSAALARQTDYVIDYEHQTLHKEKNGQPAPAAGWFRDLEWRPGDGLYAVNVRWTAQAAADIASERYRYISPVFPYNQKTGEVLAIRMAALTNDPGLDGLTDLSEAALSALFSDQPEQESSMDELLEQLRWLLNLPVGATAEDVTAQLQKLIDQLKAGPAQAAATFDLTKYLAEFAKGATAALSAGNPDPTKFVAVATLTAVQGELVQANTKLAALEAEKLGQQVDKIVIEALSSGKLTPATEAWARDLGKTNLAALNSFIAAAAPVVVPGTTQTGGAGAGSPGNNQPSGVDLAVMSALGLTAEQYAAGKIKEA